MKKLKSTVDYYSKNLLLPIFFLALIVGLLSAVYLPVRAEEYEEEYWRYIAAPVGQGDAFLLLNPNDEAAVLDAGTASDHEYWTGEDVPDTHLEVFTDLLDYHGVEDIETMVITHPHYDHISLMEDLIEEYHVNEIWDVENDHTSSAYFSLLDLIDEEGITYRQPTRGEDGWEILPGTEVEIVQPPDADDTGVDPPDDRLEGHWANLAFTFEMNGVTVLHTGDAEKSSEREWVEGGLVDDSVDILKVAHHGSNTSTGDELLDHIEPSEAIIPVGEDNDYGHPHSEVISRLEERDIEIHRTDEDGYVEVRVDGEGFLNLATYHEATGDITVVPAEDEQVFEVGPNPFKVGEYQRDLVRFQFDDYEDGATYDLEIYTLSGREVFSGRELEPSLVAVGPAGIEYYEVTWDVEDVAAGRYIYRIEDNNTGNSDSGQVVIIR